MSAEFPAGEDAEVSTYSGAAYAERPVSFRWQGASYVVLDVDRAWLEPGLRCFAVRTATGERFRLAYDESGDRWTARAHT